jgi:hypothetical protein
VDGISFRDCITLILDPIGPRPVARQPDSRVFSYDSSRGAGSPNDFNLRRGWKIIKALKISGAASDIQVMSIGAQWQRFGYKIAMRLFQIRGYRAERKSIRGATTFGRVYESACMSSRCQSMMVSAAPARPNDPRRDRLSTIRSGKYG